MIGFWVIISSIISFWYCNYNNIRILYDWTVDICNFDLSDCYNFPWGGEDYEELVFSFDWIITPSLDSSIYDYNIILNTWDLYSWYILESEIDNLYCEENWYCPVIDTWSIESWNWSALFINDIQHVSAPLINITIPEEFDWVYTWTEEEFDLDVKWYNVDTEYIDWLIRTQTTLPNSTDFNNTVSWLIPLFVPWLVIILLIYFIFRFIKKIF